MSENIVVAIGFRMDEALVASIEAVDPRIETVLVPEISAREQLEPAARAKLMETLARAEVVLGNNSIAAEWVDALPNMKWLQVIQAGVDRMAEAGLLNRGYTVTTMSGLTAPAIAEWVMGVLVMLAKGMHLSVRDQSEQLWRRRFVAELGGKTVGIAGMGAVGRETARRAHAFGMQVIGSRRTAPPGATDPDCDELVPHSQLGSILERSDFVVLCVPLTPETHHLIGEAELRRMKPTASLVNIARGPVVDQRALIKALQEGWIASAAVDVTDPEPLPADNELWRQPNLIITPHISGSIENYLPKATEMFLANLRRYVAGEPLRNLVKPELGY